MLTLTLCGADEGTSWPQWVAKVANSSKEGGQSLSVYTYSGAVFVFQAGQAVATGKMIIGTTVQGQIVSIDLGRIEAVSHAAVVPVAKP